MEESVENLLSLLPEDEREFIKKLFHDPSNLSAYNVHEGLYLSSVLYRKPFPALQLIQSEKLKTSNYIQHILFSTFLKLLRDQNEEDSSNGIKILKFLNYLTNYNLPEQYENVFKDDIFPQILGKKDLLSWKLYLSLLARRDNNEFLSNYLQFERKELTILHRRRILYETLMRRENVFLNLIRKESPTVIPVNTDESNNNNEEFRNVICLLKIINFINTSSKILEDPRKLEEIFSLMNVDKLTTELQKKIYKDLSRIYNVLKFSYKHNNKTINIKEILNNSSILDVISENMDILQIGYENVKNIFEMMNTINANNINVTHVNNNNNSCNSPNLFLNRAENKETNKDLEILSYFFILIAILDIILNGTTEETHVVEKRLSELTTILRQIKDIDILCDLIDNVFSLIFLRWEHLPKDKMSSSSPFHVVHRTSSYYTIMEGTTTMDPLERHVSGEKVGFICESLSLKLILQFLKNLTAKRFHTEVYRKANSTSQARFTKLVDSINDALWRYSLFEKNISSSNNEFIVNPNESVNILEYHLSESIKKSDSSDELCNERRRYSFTRRRTKMKSRKSIINSQSGNHQQNNLYIVNNNERGTLEHQRSDKTIIVKMLGSSENLATISLSGGDLSLTKHIIQSNNLQNTHLERELVFLESMNQTKKRLTSIFEKYKQEESQQTSTISTIQHIKKVAGIGFEASKISTIIEKYSFMNIIEQDELTVQLMKKFSNNYSFLQQYIGNSLQSVLILDLILNSPFNFEITSNIYHMTERLYGNNTIETFAQNLSENTSAGGGRKSSDGTSSSTTTASGHPMANSVSVPGTAVGVTGSQTSLSSFNKEIGCFPFFKDLVECMYLLKIHDEKNFIQVKDVLIDNCCYSLKPRKLEEQLRKEVAFKKLYSRNVNSFNSDMQIDWKNIMKLFDEFNSKINYSIRFFTYINNIRKLLSLFPGNIYQEIKIYDILQLDIIKIIGDLIFKENMTPMEIENSVFGINLNFLHVIALNMCPEIALMSYQCTFEENTICGDEKKDSEKCEKKIQFNYETIINYIGMHNSLLGFLLKEICKIEVNIEMGNEEYFKRILTLSDVQDTAILYRNNSAIASLLMDTINVKNLSTAIQDKFLLCKIINNFVENPNLKETLKDLRNTFIMKCLKEFSIDGDGNFYLIEFISDLELKMIFITENYLRVSDSNLLRRLIRSVLLTENHQMLHHSSSTMLLKTELEEILKEIEIYTKISNIISVDTWIEAYEKSIISPILIIENLLKLKEFKLCYDWARKFKLYEKLAPMKMKTIFSLILNTLTEISDDNNTVYGSGDNKDDVISYLLQFIEAFPEKNVIEFYDTNLNKIHNIKFLNYVIKFLWNKLNDSNSKPFINNSPNRNISILTYKNYLISLKIFEILSLEEREENWNIFNRPLLLIEQFLMNSKHEILNDILKSIRPILMFDDNISDGDNSNDNNSSNNYQFCRYCNNQSGIIYNFHSAAIKNSSGTSSDKNEEINKFSNLRNENSSAFHLLNFNLYQNDHVIKEQCINFLLKIYAMKALDYQVHEIFSSSSEKVSQSTPSIDSLCGVLFKVPKMAPAKERWIRDEDATYCMCCKRAVFSMFIRRHHCRRCGRVICFTCSANRMKIPELYQDVSVRVCNDCFMQSDTNSNNNVTRRDNLMNSNGEGSIHPLMSTAEMKKFPNKPKSNNDNKWLLSGNITHDKLLREEFCYEYAPSVALCLSILSFHTKDEECVEFLLYHCRKLEKLLTPNPEVDYGMIAKMLSCLAVAAKVRGGPPECETIRNHCEIITALVENGCESLLPSEPLNNHSLRKLGDSLIEAEKWSLALNVFLKCGFSTAGVMAAHGLSCLRAGCFDTAREKFSYCMTRLCKDFEYETLRRIIANEIEINVYNKNTDIPTVKRPNRSPPLLEEILKIIESSSNTIPQPETLLRASVIKNSNTSLASIRSKRKENIPMNEPAINVLNTLANLKGIVRGQYTEESLAIDVLSHKDFLTKKSEGFEECIFYILMYGSHGDVIDFLVRYEEYSSALKYFIIQSVSNEIFVHNIYLKFLRRGNVELLIKLMLEIDDRLLIWKDSIIYCCRYLETKNLLNCLYQLQILLNDPIRASMTCVRFYSLNCTTFSELEKNSFHLKRAQKHLQTELELFQWENINITENNSNKWRGFSIKSTITGKDESTAATSTSYHRGHSQDASTFLMQMDKNSLNIHINTIRRQLQVTEFLSRCEKEDKKGKLIEQILKQIRLDTNGLPTLFDSMQEKIQLCILILLCGKTIEEGFSLALKIIQNFKLPAVKVYGATAKYLSRNGRLIEVETLINCIIANNERDKSLCDEILTITVHSAVKVNEMEIRTILDNLIKKITNIELKISCHIYIGQLKAAYILAVQYNRINDVRRILRHAETTNQIHIKRLCEKKLNITKFE